ncbi:Activity-regulated cytoskeleton associated protein 2 [Eumeta japonica]|uniref:Activity-regulated cytoskeleton associated protein 2 n=1 Tax=Eumeta variegata TaxID=151549 RepID=A0A4C2ABX8_EUMVA|nr:Activity-regulated cytoskeleton associated protein 2 [Eumeta japonica]
MVLGSSPGLRLPPPHLTGSSVAPRSPCLTCATVPIHLRMSAPTATPAPLLAGVSEDQLAALLSTLARSQAESNRILIQSLLAPAPNGDGMTSPTPSSAALGSPFCSAASARSGSFAKCTARFDGSASDPDVLETFLDAIEVYKECLNINDEHALRGLPILLTGNAAVWWRDVLVNKSRPVEESLAEAVTTKAGAADRVLRLVGCPLPAASRPRAPPASSPSAGGTRRVLRSQHESRRFVARHPAPRSRHE